MSPGDAAGVLPQRIANLVFKRGSRNGKEVRKARPHPGLLPQEKVRGEAPGESKTRPAAFPLLGERVKVREGFNLETLRLPHAIKLPRLLREPHVEVHEVEGHGGDVRLDERCAVMDRPHPGLLPQEKVRGKSPGESKTRPAAFPLLGERVRVREGFNLETLRLPDPVKLPRLLGDPHVEVHEVEGHGGDVRGEERGPIADPAEVRRGFEGEGLVRLRLHAEAMM
jgi:nitrogen fixation protein